MLIRSAQTLSWMNDINLRLKALAQLGEWLRSDPDEWKEIKNKARSLNPWFSLKEIDRATNAIVDNMLSENVLREWAGKYDLAADIDEKDIGLILAGNIPMVGWHDVQCVYLSGHRGLIKYSSKDDILIPFLLEKITDFDSNAESRLLKADKLKGYDAVIATGSNNTSRYFNSYFKNVPNIIRQHRNSVSVVNGQESRDEIEALGEDIFSYFGLGCRNVTHLYLPKGYDPAQLISVWDEVFSYVIDHNKYKNNYDYNYAIWLLNKEDFMAGVSVLMKNDDSYLARIGSVNYQYYTEIDQVAQQLTNRADAIQCIVSKQEIGTHLVTKPGEAQKPAWNDYADNVDTMKFLKNLN